MSTLALAKAKWLRKMRDAGARWKAAVTGKRSAYAEGLGRFAGVTPGTAMPSHYEEGVGAVTAEEFGKAVAGKEDRWASRLVEAITATA
jgi:hypothetical protein